MQYHFSALFRLAMFFLALVPASAMATLPADAPKSLANTSYDTDTTNSYVQDQVTEDINAVNGFLCLISAMAPSQLVNTGDYIALVDGESCFTGGSGKQTSDEDKSASYIPMQVNSSRTSNTAPMYTKIWIDYQDASVRMFGAATQAPSKAAPYGVFRVDGCLKDVMDTSDTCIDRVGYVDASKSGLEFYFYFKETSGTSAGNFNEFKLRLTSSSTLNSGSGVLVKNDYDFLTDVFTPTVTMFAYNNEYFYRKDKTAEKCFDRNLDFAEESVWRYALYKESSGERLDHPMGYPIEYIYSTANTSGTGVAGKTYQGYISYYGLSMEYGAIDQIQVPDGETVYKVTYNTSPPAKTPYKLLKTGGKLVKHSTTTKTLAALDKVPFRFYAYGTTLPAQLTAGSTYEIYWDNAAADFKISGKENGGSMETYLAAVPVTSAEMFAANQYGFGSWSDLLGGWFNVYPDTGTYSASSKVIIQTENVVYPSEFDAINTAGGLKCIGFCPDSTANSPVTLNAGWGPFVLGEIQSYSLNSSTGNLHYGAPSGSTFTGNAVVKTSATTLYSGQMVSAADFNSITSAKPTCPNCSYYTSDLSLLTDPVYYTWQTSSDNWDQMAFLKNEATTPPTIITFYPPLPINFVVPNKLAYGALQGKTVALQYGDYGNLWGIPYKCIDVTDNTDCVYDDPNTPSVEPSTPSANKHWAPRFSIPFNTTEGYVTVGNVGTSQGAINTGDRYLVKALDKEIRLSETDMLLCQILDLTKPVTVPSLPSYSKWLNPLDRVGPKTTLDPATNAPRVIQGVKQY
jgi:hypothetical protein